eukprot:m.1384253 g.1384253  ORF g.1384253 m.1384253 type:complete len:79 (-) comp24973_c0_seq146:2040-2276(-)
MHRITGVLLVAFFLPPDEWTAPFHSERCSLLQVPDPFSVLNGGKARCTMLRCARLTGGVCVCACGEDSVFSLHCRGKC